jgi:hypothetical protein
MYLEDGLTHEIRMVYQNRCDFLPRCLGPIAVTLPQ